MVANFHRQAEHSPERRAAVLDDAAAMWEVANAKEESLTVALKYTFEQYNTWEGGVNRSRMDKIRFHKVLRHDSQLAFLHQCFCFQN